MPEAINAPFINQTQSERDFNSFRDAGGQGKTRVAVQLDGDNVSLRELLGEMLIELRAVRIGVELQLGMDPGDLISQATDK